MRRNARIVERLCGRDKDQSKDEGGDSKISQHAIKHQIGFPISDLTGVNLQDQNCSNFDVRMLKMEF